MDYEQDIRGFTARCEQEVREKTLMLQYIDSLPHILTRDNPLAHFTASAWIVNESRDRVLMIWHNQYRSWAWTGGHADGDGDLLRVAMREAREETGLNSLCAVCDAPVSLEILGVDGHIKRGAFVASHLHLNLTYLLTADDCEPLTVKPDENSAVCWMTPGEAVERSEEPYMRGIYRKLNQRIFGD